MILLSIEDAKLQSPTVREIDGAYYDAEENEYPFVLTEKKKDKEVYFDIEWLEFTPNNTEDVEADIMIEFMFLD